MTKVIKMMTFFFLAFVIYSILFLNSMAVVSLFLFIFFKLIGGEYDIWSLSFFIDLVCYSSAIGLGFALYLTNKEIDNGMFQDGVNNGIKR